MIVRMDDYEEVLGMEFLKQYEPMMVPHMKKLYIYNGQDYEASGVPIVVVMIDVCKLIEMNIEHQPG